MANEYLQRTPTSTGNRKVWTWSLWVKKNILGNSHVLLSGFVGNGSAERSSINLNSDNQIEVVTFQSGSVTARFKTNKLYRDVGNWMHIVVSCNTTLSDADDRLKLFINGVQYTQGFNTVTNPSQNADLNFNDSAQTHRIGNNHTTTYSNTEYTDYFWVDGQALTPEVFGFYKDGNGYISAGSTQATDFRNGQWVPRTPREIKNLINDNGGFGVNGFYLPMNDSSNFGADFHCEPNSIITLKGENLAQPRNGAPDTTDAYVSQLRSDPYAANLVLAVPGISTYRGPELVSNGNFSDGTTGSWTISRSSTLSNVDGKLRVTNGALTTSGAHLPITCEVGKVYNLSFEVYTGSNWGYIGVSDSNTYASGTFAFGYQTFANGFYSVTFKATSTTQYLHFHVYGGSSGNFKEFDNISVREEALPSDYSADIKGSGTNKTLTGNDGAGIAAIPSYYGSAMSFDGTDDYFSVPNTSDFRMGSDDFTVECWFNANDFTGGNGLVGIWNYTGGLDRRSWLLYTGSSNDADFIVSSNGTSAGQVIVSSPANMLSTNQWNHLVGEKEGNTIRLYVNGVVVGISTVAPSSLYENTDDTLKIGTWDAESTEETNGYIQDVRVYKGVAKYKGVGFDVPKPYTPVGIGTWRAVSDTCQNNFCTMNPLIGATQRSGSIESTIVTYSDGNLTTKNNASGGWAPQMQSHSNFGMTTGKWYWECSNFSTTNNEIFGISKGNEQGSPTGSGTGIESLISYNGNNGTIYINSQSDTTGPITGASATITNSAGSALSSTSDVVGFAFDADNSSMTVYLNGTLNNTATSITPTPRSVNLPWVVTKASNSSGTASGMTWNFGQNPTFSGTVTAGTYTDSNGKGLFKYQPPEGFLALCEDNLPTPAIKDPGEHFKTVLYTGSNGLNSIDSVGFKPDLVWVKKISTAGDNKLVDSVRGSGIVLETNTTDVEGTETNNFAGFSENGFDLGNNNAGAWNESPYLYAAWCWKAGGAAVLNTDGSIASQVSVNQDAGFSIVSWTSDNSNANRTVGHGLNNTPKFIILKSRDEALREWLIWHNDIGGPDQAMLFNTQVPAGSRFGPNAPTSEVFGVYGGQGNRATTKFISYCWSEVSGYSKFGSYVGNGSADGPFVYCGFKPAWIMIKCISDASNWLISDSSRNSTNPVSYDLYANLSDAQYTSNVAPDFVSNGFKMRTSNLTWNGSGRTYIFAAFAESPFKYANSK